MFRKLLGSALAVLLAVTSQGWADTAYLASGQTLYSLDVTCIPGHISSIGSFGGGLSMNGIAWDGGTLYGVSGNQLYTINTSTGAATATANTLSLPCGQSHGTGSGSLSNIGNTTYAGLVIETEETGQAEILHVATSGSSGSQYASTTTYVSHFKLAGRPGSSDSPELYACDTLTLYSINCSTGAYTQIANLKNAACQSVTCVSACCNSSGTLYIVGIPNDGTGKCHLYTVNTSTGACTNVSQIGDGSEAGSISIH